VAWQAVGGWGANEILTMGSAARAIACPRGKHHAGVDGRLGLPLFSEIKQENGDCLVSRERQKLNPYLKTFGRDGPGS